jgi:peroxidase
MDSSFAKDLAQTCNGSETKPVPLDPASPFVFDASYYRALEAHMGLLFSDQVLAMDNRTSGLVASYASSPPDFFADFADSMVRLSGIGALTGDSGEIRTDCTAINP